MNGAGSSRSTPVTSRRPISKISGSSMLAAPRLPVKVGCAPARRRLSAGLVGRPCTVQHHEHLLAARATIGRAILVGVDLRSRRRRCRSSSSGRPASSRETGTPPSTPFAASCSITLGRVARHADRELVEERVVEHARRPAPRQARRRARTALAWLMRGEPRAGPASPSRVRWMVKASAQRPELVQMFEVALSRRICCSRVDSVSTKPRRPSASTVSPQSRPGIWRTNFCRVANRPT